MARYLGIYDTDTMMNWTRREYDNFMKGARLREIDKIELAAMQSIFYVKAKSKKRINGVKDIYDVEKSRKDVFRTSTEDDDKPLHMDRYLKAKEAMKNYVAPAIIKQKGV